MDRGRNVRSPSLEKGTSYIMKSWGKTHTFEQVMFDGFITGGQTYKSPTKQLKDMEATDQYLFVGENGKFIGKMLDNCLVHGTTEARITFFALLGATTALASTTVAPEVTAAPEVPAAEAPAEVGEIESTEVLEAASADAILDTNEPIVYNTYNPDMTVEQALEANDAAALEASSETATHTDDAGAEATASEQTDMVTETPAERRRRLDAAAKRAKRAAAKAAVMPPPEAASMEHAAA